MGKYTGIASTSDIPEGKLKVYEIDYHRILIAHTSNGFHAVADECTHDRVSLGEGCIHDDEIVCPAHGARFNLRTGAVVAPPAVVPLDTIELKIEGDEIFVLLEE